VVKRSPEDANYSVHCRRVAATGAELARVGGLTPRDQEIAHDAGLVHHYPRELLNFKAIAPLLMRPGCRGANQAAFVRHVLDTLAVLTAMDPLSIVDRRDPLPDLMAAAHWAVEITEAGLPAGEDVRDGVLARIRRRTEEGIHSRRTYAAVAKLPRPSRREVSEAAARLPVYPAVALRALRVAAREDASFTALASIACEDQVLASHLISAANSCLYGSVARIATIGHAMTYMGLEETRRILMAGSMRRAFASTAAAELWKYSLHTARWCEAASEFTPAISPDVAFLAGLVHDIGRLVILHFPGEAGTSMAHLLQRGCDPLFAEMLLFGCDHSGIAAEVLTGWSFPESIIEGVRWHHRPERSESPLASLLFLADACCSDRIGVSSAQAERHALAVTGLDAARLEPRYGSCAGERSGSGWGDLHVDGGVETSSAFDIIWREVQSVRGDLRAQGRLLEPCPGQPGIAAAHLSQPESRSEPIARSARPEPRRPVVPPTLRDDQRYPERAGTSRRVE
jgi:HD-like signal output (HDOD) protein